MDFYDEIAGEYDRITDAAGRVGQAEEFLKELTSRYAMTSALDAACGTGLYARLLAKMGVRAVGADLSEGMLQQARRLAGEAKVRVEWVRAAMQELAARVPDRFDALLCMGNSIPHLLSDGDLDAAVGGFLRLLNPGGIVVLQLLNYARILARRERIVGINRQANREYVRFYDFLPRRVRFNILEVAWDGDRPEHRLHSTELRPYLADELREALIRHGCRDVQMYSGLRLAPFKRDCDETVVLVGQSLAPKGRSASS